MIPASTFHNEGSVAEGAERSARIWKILVQLKPLEAVSIFSVICPKMAFDQSWGGEIDSLLNKYAAQLSVSGFVT